MSRVQNPVVSFGALLRVGPPRKQKRKGKRKGGRRATDKDADKVSSTTSDQARPRRRDRRRGTVVYASRDRDGLEWNLRHNSTGDRQADAGASPLPPARLVPPPTDATPFLCLENVSAGLSDADLTAVLSGFGSVVRLFRSEVRLGCCGNKEGWGLCFC